MLQTPEMLGFAGVCCYVLAFSQFNIQSFFVMRRL
jgi:hypothetical protein